jgi:ppGpp synthetase/RelA/SpoT-type nucleotidyltranferase
MVKSNGLPAALRSPEGLEEWYEPLRRKVQPTVLEVYLRVEQALHQERIKIRKAEGTRRRIWDLSGRDGSSLVKTAHSLHSKIMRKLDEQNRQSISPAELEDMVLGFPDLGRFRIICDFSCDVERAIDLLLDREHTLLLDTYAVHGKVKDYVYDLSRRRPDSGHRARQLAVKSGQYLIEIQLMTLLQHAWDRRNHPLYEWTRDGNQVSERLVISDVALAETLYLVDEQATRNWQELCRIMEDER